MARLEEEEREKQRIVGERVAEAREARRLTQPVVADRVGVTLRTVQNWEAGDTRISWKNLPDLAHVLGVTEDWLLTGGEHGELPADVTELPTGLQAELAEINRKLDLILSAMNVGRDALREIAADTSSQQTLAELAARTELPAPSRRGSRRSA